MVIGGTAEAQTVPFYQGKTIRLVVGTTTGGGYDRWARFFARYMPKYIPGNPRPNRTEHARRGRHGCD